MIQPKLIEWVIDHGIGAGVAKNIIYGAAGILITGLIGNAANLFSGFSLIKAGQGLSHEIRGDLFRKIVSFSFINFDKWRTGELMVRLNSDVNTVRMFIRMGLSYDCQSVVTYSAALLLCFTDVRLPPHVHNYGATLIVFSLCKNYAPFS
jgi:ATP-binding cassette subfamily B protein